MSRIYINLIVSALMTCAMFGSHIHAAEHKPTEITVGYFQSWPTPNQFAQFKQTYESALGLKVNWLAFKSSDAMRAAMVAGEVQIGFALSHVSFVAGVTQGLSLTMVGIALDYSAKDNCIVADTAGIADVKMLEGRKVALRVGSMTHFRMHQVLVNLSVDPSRVELVPMRDGAAIVDALRTDEVAMACAYGGTLSALEKLGKPLMTPAEQAAIGLKVFDVVAVPTEFLEANPKIVQDFMDVTEAANIQWRKNPGPMRAAIARAAGMVQTSSDATLQSFSFPSAAEQKSDAWMGRLVPQYLKQIADFFVQQKQLEKALDHYDRFITTRFLR